MLKYREKIKKFIFWVDWFLHHHEKSTIKDDEQIVKSLPIFVLLSTVKIDKEKHFKNENNESWTKENKIDK